MKDEDLITCALCGEKFKSITQTHLKNKHGISTTEYRNKYGKLSSDRLSKILSKCQTGKKTGDSNPARRKEVRDKISKSLKNSWGRGDYIHRLNGMIGMVRELHHGFKPEVHTPAYLAERDYVKFLSKFEDVTKCCRCGRSDIKINVHHIDENHKNFMISNLEPLCVPCHLSFHYSRSKEPFVRIGKIFKIDAAHFLPNYEGKCNNLHGHQWKLEVCLMKRIDKTTRMVMDFSDLKTIVNDTVVSQLDHSCINDKIENPTAENILIWCWEKLMFEGFLKGIEKITIWETDDSYASLDKKGMLSIFSSKVEGYLTEEEWEEWEKRREENEL